MKKNINSRALLFVAILALISFLVVFRDAKEPELPPPGEYKSTPPALLKTYSIANATYVGIDSCRECHSERVHEFSETAHFDAARLPESHDVMGEFEPGRNVYQTRDPNLRFEMTTDGTNYFQTRIEKTEDGERRERKQAAMIYGTGLLDEIYLFWEGNQIHEMPIAYAGPLKRWINAPGYVDGQADFTSNASLCIHCHNTRLKPIAGTTDEFHRDGVMASISCEKCHGPSSEHIAYHRDFPNAADGKYIADPGSMTRKQKNDLCSECHSDLGQPRQPLFSYRPGDALEDFYVVSNRQKSREDQHTANHIRYLQQSKCFQKSDSLTCVTCHDPHSPEGPNNSLSVKRSCLGCHQPAHCGERANLPTEARDRCIACHMPRRRDLHTAFHGPDKLHVPGRKRREHRIAVYPQATQKALIQHYRSLTDADSKGKAANLVAKLAPELIARAEELSGEKQFASAMAAYQEAEEFADEGAPIAEALTDLAARRERFLIAFNDGVLALGKGEREKAIQLLRIALRINPKSALAYHQLGLVYQELNNHEEAIRNLTEALQLNPELPATYTHLGISHHILNDLDKAIENYERTLELKPRSSQTHNNLGLALRAKGDVQRALEHYRRAIEYDASSASAHNNMGSALARTGQLPEAIDAFRKALEISPDYADAHFNLGGLLRQTGDLPGAIESYRAAVKHADHADARNNLAMLLTMTGRHAEAIPYFTTILANRPDSVPHLVFLAKILATIDDESKRDALRAGQLATRAVDMTQRQDPNALDALALAQAASGNFEDAVKTATQAAAVAERVNAPGLSTSIRSSIESYRQNKLPLAESIFPQPPR